MSKRNSMTKIKNGKVVFSQEIIDYFENLRNEENSEWIDKYFEVLSNENNLSATKYRKHHIIPCFVFKDENHKNRLETEPLADMINGNKIKLSVYNHILSHFYLWKIIQTEDSRRPVYLMCIKKNLDCLSESEIKEFAKIQEECTKENMTEKERKELDKKWRKEHQEELSDYGRKWRKENKEREKEWRKQYNELNKERISKNKKRYRREHEKERKEWEEEHKEERKAYKRNYNREHKDDLSKKKKEKYIENRDEILANNHLECEDPIKGDRCTLVALKTRKNRHKEDYKNVNPKDYIIKSE